MFKYCCLIFLLVACSSNKKINLSEDSGIKNLHFLPVHISYTGIALEDSLKNFIIRYFQSKSIEVIDEAESENLVKSEVKRASYSISSTDPQERWNQLEKNERYVVNYLQINFKSDKDGQQIDMGWSVQQWPAPFSELKITRWKYLTNHKISDAPPQDELKTLCDSIIYSKSLY